MLMLEGTIRANNSYKYEAMKKDEELEQLKYEKRVLKPH